MSNDPDCLEQICSSCKEEIAKTKADLTALRKGMLDIVGILQGSLPDEKSFHAVYEIAKGFIENREGEVICPVCRTKYILIPGGELNCVICQTRLKRKG